MPPDGSVNGVTRYRRAEIDKIRHFPVGGWGVRSRVQSALDPFSERTGNDWYVSPFRIGIKSAECDFPEVFGGGTNSDTTISKTGAAIYIVPHIIASVANPLCTHKSFCKGKVQGRCGKPPSVSTIVRTRIRWIFKDPKIRIFFKQPSEFTLEFITNLIHSRYGIRIVTTEKHHWVDFDSI